MKLRYKIGIVISVLAAVFLWGRCGRTPVRNPQQPTVLPVNDRETITVDPIHHRIEVLTASGLKTETLPDRKSTVEVRKDGQIKIVAPQTGFETRPFVGLGFGNGFRGYIGADLWYFKKLDLGLGAVTPKLSNPELTDTRLGMFASYAVYDNTRLSLGYDTSKTIHVLLSVRL